MLVDPDKMAIGEKEVFGETVQGVGTISQLITRYTFWKFYILVLAPQLVMNLRWLSYNFTVRC